MIIVYSYYVLDIVHKGHLEMLKNAKAMAGPDGKLIVGILTDDAALEVKAKPTLSFEERVELARSIKEVDLVVAQVDQSPINNIYTLKPDILMESTSHRDYPYFDAVWEIMKEWNGRVICVPYFPNHSSSLIKDTIKNGQS